MKEFFKIPFVRMNSDDSDVAIQLGEYREAYNLIPAEGGTSNPGSRQNVPGTVAIANGSLAAGTNTCIGTLEDRAGNRIIYWLHNTNNNHSVWYYSGSTGTHTKIIQNSILNFSSSNQYKITGAGIVGNLLYWTDGLNPQRMVEIGRNYSAITDDRNITLIKPAPRIKPRGFGAFPHRTTDSTRTTNFISGKNFQFAYRYKYVNNEVSALSPISSVFPASIVVDTMNPSTSNTIRIYVYVDALTYNLVKKVEVMYRIGVNGEWRIFKTITPNQSVSSTTVLGWTGVTYYLQEVYFYGNEGYTLLSDQEKEKAFDVIPLKSKALAVDFNRVFTVDDLSNFDVTESDSSISVSKITRSASVGVPNLKDGGGYTVGIVYFDKYGRNCGVKNLRSFTVARPGVPSSSNRTTITVSLTGTPPVWAHYYQIVMTRNEHNDTYLQVPGIMMRYHSDFEEGRSAPSGTTRFLNDKFYITDGSPSSLTGFKRLHIQLPSHLPFLPDNTFSVKMLDDGILDTAIEKINSVEANVIGVNNFGAFSDSNTVLWRGIVTGVHLFEIFKPKEVKEKLFYAISGTFRVTNPETGSRAFSDTNPELTPGDTYWVDRSSNYKYFFENLNPGSAVGGYSYPTNGEEGRAHEAPAPNLIPVDQVENIDSKNTVANTRYNVDYTSPAAEEGAVFVDVSDEFQTSRTNVVQYSDPYIPNSLVNGLSSFVSGNESDLAINSGSIKKLQPVGDGSVILSIHQRGSTSIYVGKGFITTSDGGEILAKTSGVIGDTRTLNGSYGTAHAESVVEHSSAVYWYDVYNNEIIRYRNGLTPLASVYKIKNWLKTKSDALISGNGTVISGFNPKLKMLFMTFIIDGDTETIGFLDKPGQEGFISIYNFTPEYYATLGDKMYAFVAGQMYEMMASDTYNNFFGVQYDSTINPVFNVDYSKNKILRNIAIESNECWSVPSITNNNTIPQLSHLNVSHFVKRENTWYADIRRDENTNPLLLSGSQIAFLSGHEMNGKSFDFQILNDSDELVTIDAINFGYVKAGGQRVV